MTNIQSGRYSNNEYSTTMQTKRYHGKEIDEECRIAP